MIQLTELLTSISKLEDTLLKVDVPPAQLLSIKETVDQIRHSLTTPKSDPPVEKKTALKSSHMIQIWTDGACSGNQGTNGKKGGPGGWGALIQTEDGLHEYSGYAPRTTNNIMEMTAALEALKKTSPGSTIELTSDSKYLVDGITKWIHGWKKRNWKKADGGAVLNQEIWKAIDLEAGQRRVTWKWVKGHAGHFENERCDELAREAIRNQRGY